MRISDWSSDVCSSDLVTGSDAWLPAAIQTTPGVQPKDSRGCGGEPDAGAQGSLIPVPPGQHCGPQIAPRHVRFLALATTATAGQPGRTRKAPCVAAAARTNTYVRVGRKGLAPTGRGERGE